MKKLFLLTLAFVAALAPPTLRWAYGADVRRRAVITVEGVACPFCAYGIDKHLRAVPGVTDVQVDLGASKVTVDVAPGANVTEEALQRAIRDAGFTPGRIEWASGPKEERLATATFAVEGMRCEYCATNIDTVLQGREGVRSAKVDLSQKRVTVVYDPARVNAEDVEAVIEGAGKFQATRRAGRPAPGPSEASASAVRLALHALVALDWSCGPPAQDEVGRAARYAHETSWRGEDLPGGPLERPIGVAVGGDGSVYVTDARRRVLRLDRAGVCRSQWGRRGDGPGEFGNPIGLAVGPTGEVYVSDYEHDRVQVFSPDGRFLRQFGRSDEATGEFRAPAGLALGLGEHVYVADFYNSRVQEFTRDGEFVRIIGHPGRLGAGALHYPTDVAVLRGGRLLVADAYNYQLQWFDERGSSQRRLGHRLLGLWPRPADGRQGFNVPTGVAVGPEGRIHVADSANHRVVMLDPEGGYLAEWRIPDANPKIYSPEQVAVSPDGATVYATDLAGNRLIVLAVRSGEQARLGGEEAIAR
jgi:copper ion binding protein